MVVTQRKKEQKKSTSTRWELKRDKILSVSQDLFWQKGYDGTSIQDIANAAKINKATIYYYFESKPVLLYEIASKSLNTLTDMALTVINSDLPPEKKLERLIFNQIIWSLSHPRNAATVILEKRNLPPKLLQVIISKRDHYENMFREVLKELIPKKRAQQLSPKIASFFIFGLIFSLTRWYKQGGELSPEEVASRVYMLISDGLSIPKST